MLINSFEDLNVLVVEEDSTIRNSLCEYFNRMSVHSVVETESLKRANYLLGNSRINLVTFHSNNEHMSSVEFVHNIKQKHNMEVFLLLITSNSDRDSVFSFIDLGVSYVILKPVSFDLLQEVVLKIIRQSQFI